MSRLHELDQERVAADRMRRLRDRCAPYGWTFPEDRADAWDHDTAMQQTRSRAERFAAIREAR